MQALSNFIQTPSFTNEISERVDTLAERVSRLTNENSYRLLSAGSSFASTSIKVTNFALSNLFCLAEGSVRTIAAVITSPLALHSYTRGVPVHLGMTALINLTLAINLI